MKRTLMLIPFVILLMALVPMAVSAADPVTCQEEVVVVKDDWLAKYADKYFGNPYSWPAIFALHNKAAEADATKFPNKIVNADLIEVGWTICIPTVEDADAFLATYDPTQPSTDQAKYGGILKFGQAQTPQGLNAWAGALLAASDASVTDQIYEGLLTLDGSYNVRPALAESWDILSETEYVFHLRKGVKFHNGKEVMAEDVVYSYENSMNPDVSVYAGRLSSVQSVEAVDDYTVKFTLKEPYSELLFVLGRPPLYVTPVGTIEKEPFEYIGTGPFMIKEYVPGVTVELVKFEDYWEDGIPYLDGISYANLTDDAARVANLRAKAADFIMLVPGASWAQLSADPNIKLYTGDTGIFFIFTFNVDKEPFTDPNVRKALQYIPDKQVMCDVYTSGRCNRWFKGDPQPPDSEFYTGIETYGAPDLEKAKEYLAMSNYPDGFEFDILFYGPASDEGQIAEIFQVNAAEVGIKINVKATDEAVWREKVYKGDFQSAMQGLRAIGPDEIFYQMMHPEGSLTGFSPGYDNAEYNALVEEARRITDPKERQALYQQALELGYEEGWSMIYLYTYDDRMGMLSDVMGYQTDGLGTPRFLKYVWLDR